MSWLEPERISAKFCAAFWHSRIKRDFHLPSKTGNHTQTNEGHPAEEEQQTRLRTALSIARLGTFEWNVRTNAVTLDERSREIFGFAPGQGTTAPELFARVHPEDLERVRAEARRSRAELSRLETEYRILLPEGSVRVVASIHHALPGADGQTEWMFGVFSDITERQQAEAALRDSELRLRRALEIDTVAIIFFDLEGNLTRANDAFLRMSGYTREDLAAGPLRWDQLTPAEWMPVTMQTRNQLAATGKATPYEKQYLRKDGSRWWGLFAPRMLNEHEAVEFILDITDRKEAEAALRHSREELAQFAHTVAHDLQTPLRNIRSYSQLLAQRYREQLDPTANTFLQLIMDGAEGMHQLVRALLRYAEVGEAAAERKPVRVDEVLAAVLASLQPECEETGAQIVCQDLPMVEADPVQLTQLFQNLVSNALKYRKPHEPPRITISAQPCTGSWLFSVQDNGQGIPSQYLETIFQPLKRLHGKEIPGSGLGLAWISHKGSGVIEAVVSQTRLLEHRREPEASRHTRDGSLSGIDLIVKEQPATHRRGG